MGEIAMTAISPELMAAMNIFGGTGDMTAVSAENNVQCASFGNVLRLLMANSVQAQVQDVPEMVDTEIPAEPKAADVLIEALNENAETKLPDVFTEKGTAAFIETISRILPEYDGDELPRDIDTVPQVIDTIWKNVSPEEKSAFAELLYAAAEISEDESIMAEKSPEDIVRIICRIMVNSARKPEKKASDKPVLSDEAVLLQGIPFVRPVQAAPVEADCEENQADSEPVIMTGSVTAAYSQTAEYPETERLQTADTEQPVQADAANAPKAENTDKVPFEELQNAYQKLSEASPRDIASFCRKLADKLNASVKVTAPAADAAPENADNSHIEFGRQGLQGFMARVNRHEELISDENVQVIPEQVENKAAVNSIPPYRSVPAEDDVPSQIMRQIDLYRNVFEENFSEKEISMKLSPETLGGVEIRIRKSDKGFEITFTAEKAEAAELIVSRSSELREALASRGIALNELSVTRQIVTNESDGSLAGDAPFGNGSLYGDARNGQNSSGRQFAFSGQDSSDSAEQAEDRSSDNNFNREAKLWVSA